MNRRIVVAATLAVLTALVGGRWLATRPDQPALVPAAAAHGRLAAPPASAAALGPGNAANESTPSPSAAARNPTAVPRPPVFRANTGPFGSRRLTGKRAVALTFDDGPSPQWTPLVLDLLRRAGVKATFCVIGMQVQKYPELVARIVREGHTLCNHTWNHEMDLGTKSKATIRANLRLTNHAIQAAAPGAKVPFFRHPGGFFTPAAVEVARSMGMSSLDWDVDPRDWEQQDAVLIRSRVLGAVRPGSIVLMHDGGGDRHGTYAALPVIISTLKQRYGITQLR
jgi:peptidoglycan/xylan/chitin deacetylase (PgdA/CDA1 family)